MTVPLRSALALHGPWLYYPGGHMRLSTTLMATAIMLTGVLWTRRPYVAFVSMMAWVCAFEILWEAATTLTQRGSWSYEGWFIAAVVSWVLLAHALGVRPDWRLVAACAAVLAVWLGLGFHSNWANLPQQFSPRDEVLNESSKTLLGLAYLVGAVRVGRVDRTPMRTAVPGWLRGRPRPEALGRRCLSGAAPRDAPDGGQEATR